MMWASFGTGIVMLGLFLRHETRTPAPMIELELLKWRPFAAANAYNFLYGVAASRRSGSSRSSRTTRRMPTT